MSLLRLFASAALLGALGVPSVLRAADSAASADPLAADFDAPPPSARPRTFWFWMNGNVSADGITRDLEAMKRAGVGGFFAYDGSTYLPAGPAAYLQPHWRDLMTHAIREANRLGLDAGMQNGPGWSSSGGPWITPERSMQQLVWTETTVRGGGLVDLSLARPQANRDHYQDAMVIAFPAQPGEETRYEDEIARLASSDGVERPAATLSDGLASTAVDFEEGRPLILEFTRPLALHGLSAWAAEGKRFATLNLEVSTDGVAFTSLGRVPNPPRQGIAGPGVRDFAEPVTARFLRLTPTRSGSVGELVFHRAPRVHDWGAKANFDYRVTGQLRLPEKNQAGIDPATVRDLSALVREGRLIWEVPPGAWTVLRLGHTTTGKENVAASEAGRGLECDKLDPTGIELHFKTVIDQVMADAKAAGAGALRSLEIDSYEAGMQNWTRNFPAEFERRAGYSILGYMPALLGRVVGDAARTERFLYDFRRVQADMMAEYYYGRAASLAREHGLTFYVEGYGPGNFDELRVSGLPEVPMTEFWTRTPWTPNRPVKMVTSAAHIYGKPVVAAEAFTGEFRTSRWLEYPYALKILGDDMMAAGVNQFYFHRYAHQPHPDAVPGMTMGPYGSHLERTNTWYEKAGEWTHYLARVQQVLRHGRPVADVLYFTGERAPDPSQMAMPVLPPGYTYDLVNTDVLLNRLRVENGDYMLPEGGRYRLLVLPKEMEAMSPELAQRLREFVEAGAALAGPRPRFSPTLRGFPESEAAMLADVAEIWRTPREGETGRRVWSEVKTIGEALARAQVAPDFFFESARPDSALSWQHRRLDDGDLYFVSNRQRRVEEGLASFRGMAGRQPEIWRPETGERGEAAIFSTRGDRADLPLRLEPGESVFVLFRRQGRPLAAELRKDGQPILSAAPLPPAMAPAQVGSFTMAIWVKPDTDLRAMPKEGVSGRIDEVGKFYAIPADPGEARFGADAATAGLAVGRNGIFVVERAWDSCPAVLVLERPVSGWTHVAVVYRDGTPSLHVNGEFVREGLRSGKKVHGGVGSPPPPVDYTLYFPGLESLAKAAKETAPPSRGNVFYFEGNSAGVRSFDRALDEADLRTLVAEGVPAPVLPVAGDVLRGAKGGASLLAWAPGSYQLGAEGKVVEASPGAPRVLDGAWTVEFQAGRGAPERIALPELRSLHLHEDPGVRHFSGTAAYRKTMHVPREWLETGRCVVLDLGRVEVLAEIVVNGRAVPVVWKEPYRADITELVRAGDNDLEVRVTNLWTNRLIGDQSLPVEDEFGLRDEHGNDPHGIVKLPDWYKEGRPKPPGGRTTFATWNFYDADEPLVASGLLGPVRLLNPVRVELEAESPVRADAGSKAPSLDEVARTTRDAFRGVDPRLPSVLIASDSTAAKASQRPQRGWGECLPDFVDRSRWNVVNLARGGRSSRTFLTEGWWAALLANAKPGDTVLIQFAHNDATAVDSPQARGSLPGLGDETVTVMNAVTGREEVVRTFGWYVRRMIAEAKAAGLRPVLVSPTIKNSWREGRVDREAGGHAAWLRTLAKEASVPFVDLSAKAADELESLGPEKARALYQGKTHFQEGGARLHARLVAAGLQGML